VGVGVFSLLMLLVYIFVTNRIDARKAAEPQAV
jgi:hypothetical protein